MVSGSLFELRLGLGRVLRAFMRQKVGEGVVGVGSVGISHLVTSSSGSPLLGCQAMCFLIPVSDRLTFLISPTVQLSPACSAPQLAGAEPLGPSSVP